MAQKSVNVPGIGEIILSKRRGARNIRLSISAAGKVRVGMPTWLPYSAGISFAKSREDWIRKHLPVKNALLSPGVRIGKSYRLLFDINNLIKTTSGKLSGQKVHVSSPLPITHPSVQEVAEKYSEKALRKEAAVLLPVRLEALARHHGFNYSAVKIKRMTSRWGSCSTDKTVTFNYFLMQLPWPLIDYVLLHELVHTEHMNHSPAFWSRFESVYPDAKKTRSQLKSYRPVINSLS